MRLEFHPEAELEFLEAAPYYENRVAGLGQRFGADIRRTLDLLLAHPEMGIAVDADLRKYALQRFPFSLIYSLSADVLRVAGSRASKPPPRGLALENRPLMPMAQLLPGVPLAGVREPTEILVFTRDRR